MREDMRTSEEHKQRLQEWLRIKMPHWKDYGITLLKWVLFSLVVGLVVGVVGGLFYKAIAWATEFWETHGWILFFLPLAGLAIVLAYRITGMNDDKGTEYIIGAVREGRMHANSDGAPDSLRHGVNPSHRRKCRT